MKLKHYLFLGAVALILVGSFFLPNAVAGVTDMRWLDNLIMIDSQSISFETAPALSLFEKMSLAANANAESVPMKTGTVMDSDTAQARAITELNRFWRDNPWGLELGHIIEESTASLIVDTANPALNMIVWEINFALPEHGTIFVTIDDESGIIMRLVHRWEPGSYLDTEGWAPSSSDDILYSVAERLTEMMESYYMLPVELADYEFSGSLSYYRADISDGRGSILSMFGVVRSTSLTMNERV